MIQKICLLTVVMLAAWQLITAQQTYNIITLAADGTETTLAVSAVQKIVFDNNTMTVNMKSGSNITGISCVKFSGLSGIENMEVETSLFVYPNPVREYLTVSGVSKGEKINVADMNGKVLLTLFSNDNTTEINVSSLQKGVYLLQVGHKTIKFIKH
jgi:hypothetical protein